MIALNGIQPVNSQFQLAGNSEPVNRRSMLIDSSIFSCVRREENRKLTNCLSPYKFHRDQ